MTAFYNEIDPYAAQWLRNLIAAGHIAPGVVDERDIKDILPHELEQFTQCHFFAGVGVWSLALREVGWPDDRPVWTGSCPCQPFSAAGRGDGFADERHLWPHWHYLIEECRPAVVFGEQVANGDGLSWFDLVQADMEKSDYAIGAVDTCAAGFGAPRIRQRLYFVADTERHGDVRSLGDGSRPQGATSGRGQADAGTHEVGHGGPIGKLAVPAGQRSDGRGTGQPDEGHGRLPHQPQRCGNAVELGDTFGERSQGHSRDGYDSGGREGAIGPTAKASLFGDPGPVNGLWRDADWLLCTDGKWRAVEPGAFPLAHGAAARVGRLRAYGNAIHKENAKEAIAAYRWVRGLDLID